jgi:competence protein ComEC
MEVATQRAYVMALIAFGAKLFDRPALSLRSVAVALFAVVLLQPESVVSPGFQMSFAASASLIALYEIWPKLDRPDRPGILSRIGPWVIGTVATSIVASFATMPFALHHFDRAALFSVIANIISTPIITLWTTPAAAAAALAAPFGLEEPFLGLLGKSIEIVLAIAHWSIDVSPEFDLPRMSGPALAWAAVAIAIFCLASRRGRALAGIPLATSLVLWLSAPQPIGYVATDGSVFLKAEKGWLELADWRSDNGLNPLIIGDDIRKAPCKGKGEACELKLPAGDFHVISTADVPAEGCKSAAALQFTPGVQNQTQIYPCAYIGLGGAVLESSDGRLHIRTAEKQSGRAWAQPLWEKPPTVRRQPGERSTQ